MLGQREKSGTGIKQAISSGSASLVRPHSSSIVASRSGPAGEPAQQGFSNSSMRAAAASARKDKLSNSSAVKLRSRLLCAFAADPLPKSNSADSTTKFLNLVSGWARICLRKMALVVAFTAKFTQVSVNTVSCLLYAAIRLNPAHYDIEPVINVLAVRWSADADKTKQRTDHWRT